MEVPSSSSKAKDEKLEVEDVWSDLHALRKLYVLLQKSSAKIPHGENQDPLDEKSRLLLKNLLDDATQRALQSQAKIVSCAPDPTASMAKSHEGTKSSPSRESIRKESQCPSNLQKCHHSEMNDAHGLVIEATPSPQSKQLEIPPRAKAEIEPKPCPDCHLKRLDSVRSMTSPDGRARHHRQIHHEPDGDSIYRSSKATKNSNRVSAEHRITRTPEPESRGKPRQSRSPLSGTRLADIPTRRTMSQKRSRVETIDRRSDAESTRVKGSRHESTRRPVSPKDGRPTKTCLPDRTARIHQLEKRKEPSPTLKKDQVIRRLSGRTLTRTEKAPSHRRSPSRKEHVNRVRPVRELSMRSARQVGRDQVGLHGRMLPPRTPRRESIVYSSPSDTTRSDSSTSEVSVARRAGPPIAFPANAEIVPRRVPSRHASVPSRHRSPSKRVPDPCRRLSHHRAMRPSRVSAGTTKGNHEKKPEKKNGRLRRFKDKLAIIFHHHHHHHHHHHLGHVDGDDACKDGEAHHHRSPWKYLRRTLHHTSEEKGKLVTEVHAEQAVDKAPARHQHGYFRELLDALVRHVWRSRKKKAVRPDRGRLGRLASRVRVKKLHWWQRFRRQRGVKLSNGKKPRLRLGFSKTNPPTTKSPAAV